MRIFRDSWEMDRREGEGMESKREVRHMGNAMFASGVLVECKKKRKVEKKKKKRNEKEKEEKRREKKGGKRDDTPRTER